MSIDLLIKHMQDPRNVILIAVAFPGLFANFSKYFFSTISAYKILAVFLAC